MSDLRQIGRVARLFARLVPGIDIKPLVARAAGPGRRGARLPARGRGAAHASPTEFRDDPTIVVPDVVAHTDTVLVTEWLESHAVAGPADRRRHPGGARPLRRALRAVPVLGPGPRRAAARRPAPGQLPAAADDGRLGVVDYGAVARLPDGGLPRDHRRADPATRSTTTTTRCSTGCARKASSSRHQDRRGRAARLPRARSSSRPPPRRSSSRREWMRGQFHRLNDPRAARASPRC